MTIKIEKVKGLSVIKLKPLIEDSQDRGFFFVQRLLDEWIAKTRRSRGTINIQSKMRSLF